MSKVIEDEKLKMVGWYDPSQLLDTAKKLPFQLPSANLPTRDWEWLTQNREKFSIIQKS